MPLYLNNTLSRKKEEFVPLDAARIRMYVCGPTIYARPHLGNARSVVVYDVLYRLLRHLYPGRVTYARNITDVDDKINVEAIARGVTIQELTQEVAVQFRKDMQALHVLPPDIEPRATEHIPQMIAMIERLIAHGNAYEAEGHVLFAVESRSRHAKWQYGMLSGRRMEELIAGARVEVPEYKRSPGDFVLWKPAGAKDDPSSIFDSPWGRGRPGWHIECSAMSTHYLGKTFDIHGGGADLMFPHHENENAQSCCAQTDGQFARYWVHNGFLTVSGEKMAKSAGNFTTIHDLLEQGVAGEVIRYAFFKVKYNEPLDWNTRLVKDAKKELDSFYRAIAGNGQSDVLPGRFEQMLLDDLNVPGALAVMHTADKHYLKAMGNLLGILQQEPEQWFRGVGTEEEEDNIAELVQARVTAKKEKNWVEADRIRDQLRSQGVLLEDRPDGTTDWHRA